MDVGSDDQLFDTKRLDLPRDRVRDGVQGFDNQILELLNDFTFSSTIKSLSS